MRYLNNILYSIWLGASLSFCGIHFTDMRFYIITVPTIFLVTFFHEN